MERWQTVGKPARTGGEGRTPAYALKPIRHALTVIRENTDRSLVIQGWIGDKPCLVAVDTRAYLCVSRPDIADGWPERQPNQRLTLQTVSGEALPILKEVFLTLILRRRPLKIWVFVEDITNEFILRLDILRAYDASVDIGRQTLGLAEEEISLWSPGAGLRPLSLTMDEDQVIPAQCDEQLWLDWRAPRSRNWSSRTQPADSSAWRNLYSQDLGQRPPEGVLEGLKCYLSWPEADKKIPTSTMWASHAGNHTRFGTRSKLQNISEAARPYLSNGEFLDLEELLAEYEDISSVGSEGHGWTNKVYYCIDRGDDRPIRQTPRSLPLAKQMEASRLTFRGLYVIISHRIPTNALWTSNVIFVQTSVVGTAFKSV
jgi:hypothetical protein